MWGYTSPVQSTPSSDLPWGEAIKNYLSGLPVGSTPAVTSKTPIYTGSNAYGAYGAAGGYGASPWNRSTAFPFLSAGGGIQGNRRYGRMYKPAGISPDQVALFPFTKRLYKAKLVKCIHREIQMLKHVEEALQGKIKFFEDMKAYKLNLKQKLALASLPADKKAELLAKITILKWNLDFLKIKKFEKMRAIETLQDSIRLKQELLASLN